MTRLRHGLSTVLALCLLWHGTQAVAQDDALAALRAAAEAGDRAAQVDLARRYQDGDGVLQNFAHAAEWMRAAAEAGDADAQNTLGRYYHSGLGVQSDPEAALRWLAAAADQGAPQHLFDYATLLDTTGSDPAKAAELYRRAADAGHLDAAVSLGVLYQEGRGVPQDFARALELYRGPAEAQDARAMNNLGLLYVRGDGVERDYDRAAALFAAAAELGFARAMTNLGVMYENGFGVPLDEDRARALYRMAGTTAGDPLPRAVYDPRLVPVTPDPETMSTLQKAAEAGDPVAEFQLGWILATLPGAGHPEWRHAAALFRSGAEKGYAPAMANLGLFYLDGRGVPQDFVLAQMWLLLAGSAGLSDATALSAAAQARMTASQINEAQTMAEARWNAMR